MRRRGPKARTLSIFLIKEGLPSPEDALLATNPMQHLTVATADRHVGDLYVKPTFDKMPYWVSLFEDAINPSLVTVHNASAAAVLLISSSGRIFALTFGYGKSMLRPGSWEEEFGLRVTLNSVDPFRIRSLDRVKFDAISQHSQIQASRDANIVEFGLDVEQDLLRAVTGRPRDSSLAIQLTGKDALKADVRITLPEIPDLLTRFWEAFNQNTHREHFPWVDQVKEVRDPTRCEALDGTLIDKLIRRDFDRLWLAIPDRVEWGGIAGFKYRDSRRAPIHTDIHFRSFLEEAGENFIPTIDILKNRRRIYLISHETDLVAETWPLYRCIYCEIDSGTETFLLNNGKWYRIRSDFLGTVNNSFAEVVNSTFRLPDFVEGTEETYNQSVTEGEPDTYFLMDQKFIRYPTGRDTVEFCDIYSRSKLIIHVKRYRGSATLSHLFSQAAVSGELFCTLREFREAVNDLLPQSFRLNNSGRRPNNEEYEVVFAIISKSTNPLTLPFFSRVNLRNVTQLLRAFGYKVSLTKIQATGDRSA